MIIYFYAFISLSSYTSLKIFGYSLAITHIIDLIFIYIDRYITYLYFSYILVLKCVLMFQ